MSDDLIERLRKVEPDAPGERTRWYRNPDGPEAADEIERLRAENERLRGVLNDLRYPCTCDPAYYERGLVAPDCLADLCGDDAREALGEPPQCKGRKAKAAKARAALDGDGTRDGG